MLVIQGEKEPVKFGDLSVNSYFFLGGNNPLSPLDLCYKNGDGTYKYLIMGGYYKEDAKDFGPSLDQQHTCHPENLVTPIRRFIR